MARTPDVFTLPEQLAIELMHNLASLLDDQQNPEMTFDELMEIPEVHEKIIEATEQ